MSCLSWILGDLSFALFLNMQTKSRSHSGNMRISSTTEAVRGDHCCGRPATELQYRAFPWKILAEYPEVSLCRVGVRLLRGNFEQPEMIYVDMVISIVARKLEGLSFDKSRTRQSRASQGMQKSPQRRRTLISPCIDETLWRSERCGET